MLSKYATRKKRNNREFYFEKNITLNELVTIIRSYSKKGSQAKLGSNLRFVAHINPFDVPYED